jgi:hypothetical protein
MPFINELLQVYERFRAQIGPGLIGVVEIGSHARGEDVPYSDHDLRLIVRCQEPMLVMNEESWTERPAIDPTFVEWEQINPCEGMSFGLTNLEYIEKSLLEGRFPLIDHTCLYQGRVLIDENSIIEGFRCHYKGVKFPNIVPDYLRQTEWRITHRLLRELDTLTGQYNARKYPLPAVHTCYRIARDLANIASYQEHGVYLRDNRSLLRYYHTWPWYEPTLLKLQLYKANETVRRAVFKEVIAGSPDRITEIKGFVSATVRLWGEFQEQLRQTSQQG